MKIVYIAHPISGDVEGNIKKVLEIVREINLLLKDVVPFVPYLADLPAMNDNIPHERERGIRNDAELFKRRCFDELWVFGNWQTSGGVTAEVNLANSYGIPVIYKS